MNHNPYDLTIGDIVILDADLAIGGVPVEVIQSTPNNVYTKISDGESSWYVMTARLSPMGSIKSNGT